VVASAPPVAIVVGTIESAEVVFIVRSDSVVEIV
jgi:hypothetical protein